MLKRVLTIAADVFQVDESTLGPGSSPDTIESWDSLHHLSFVVALEQEFGRSLQDAASLLRDLIGGASEEEKEHFAVTYLSVSHEGLDNLLSLLRDLRWYKNWRIDTGRRRSDQA